jgi:hypothetical protein
MYVKQATALVMSLSCIALSSLGGADSVVEKKTPSIVDQELFFAPVPKAVCGPGDNPETALQGQVPATDRPSPWRRRQLANDRVAGRQGQDQESLRLPWNRGAHIRIDVTARTASGLSANELRRPCDRHHRSE